MAVIKIVGDTEVTWITNVKQVRLLLPKNSEQWEEIEFSAGDDRVTTASFPEWVRGQIGTIPSYHKHPWVKKDGESNEAVFLEVTLDDDTIECHNMSPRNSFLMSELGQTIDRF